MKRTTVFLCTILTLMCAVNAYSQQIDIDLQPSTFAPTGTVTFIVYNVTASAPELGLNGTYWAEFQRDPSNYIFVPVTYGLGYVTPPAAVDVTGTYSGAFTTQFTGSSPQQRTISANISQADSNISGTFSSSDGNYGTIMGTVTGTNSTLTFTSSVCTDGGTAQGGYYNSVLTYSGTGNVGTNC